MTPALVERAAVVLDDVNATSVSLNMRGYRLVWGDLSRTAFEWVAATALTLPPQRDCAASLKR